MIRMHFAYEDDICSVKLLSGAMATSGTYEQM